ncbi:MAG: hypothetical protein JNK87_03810 [Bryobacterales bacterium]|nr:hypothetical protein [Bryobacterales bacterium]
MAAKHAGHNRLEWGLLALIGVVCVVLSLLQYRWTGEMSRGERVRLQAGLSDRALLPGGRAVREQGLEEASRARYRQWVATHDPALFSRIAVAIPQGEVLGLRQLDADGRLLAMDWPESWEPLRKSLAGRLKGEPGRPRVPGESTLLEFPLLRPDEAEGEFRELAWMIFELSRDYVRGQMMPALVREHIHAGEAAIYEVSVDGADGLSLVYSSRADGASVHPGADFQTGLFSLENNAGGGGRGGRRKGGRGGGPAGVRGGRCRCGTRKVRWKWRRAMRGDEIWRPRSR